MLERLLSLLKKKDESFNKIPDAVTLIQLHPSQELRLIFGMTISRPQIEQAGSILKQFLPEGVSAVIVDLDGSMRPYIIAIVTEKKHDQA